MTQPKKISDILSNLAVRDAFSEVELTEDEIETALMKARQDKYTQQRAVEYKQKLRNGPAYKKFTAEELFAEYEKMHTLDNTNKDVVWELCLYFTGDDRTKLNPYKGIYLYGPIGCGKTSLMQFFRHNQANSFAVFSVQEIAGEFSKHGHDAILRFKKSIPSSDYFKTYGQTEIGACFDDLGTEVDKKHFGNEANVMSEIILCRYGFKGLHSKTHFTANLNSNDIEERYGPRVRSRLREMANIVSFMDEAPDRRV
jgi:DNA replication protein DnaC